MMTTDKPKDADILERVKDILNKKERKNNNGSLPVNYYGASLICVTFCRNL